jgi:hypothetical protein
MARDARGRASQPAFGAVARRFQLFRGGQGVDALGVGTRRVGAVSGRR